MSKKFFSKVKRVRLNFAEVTENLEAVKEDIDELKNLSEASDAEFSAKLGTKLRNLMDDAKEVDEKLTDAKVEAEELEGVTPENFSKTKSRITGKQFADLEETWAKIKEEAKVTEAMVASPVNEKASYTDAAPAPAPEAVATADQDPADKAAYAAEVAKPESETPGVKEEGAVTEVKSFSAMKVKVLRGRVARILKLFAEMTEDMDLAKDLVEEISESDEKPAEETPVVEEENKEPEVVNEAHMTCEKCKNDPCTCESEEKLEDLKEDIQNLCEELKNAEGDSEVVNFAKKIAARIAARTFKNFAEAEVAKETLEEVKADVDAEKEEADLEKAKDVVEEIAEGIENTPEDKVEASALNFAKKLVKKARKIVVKSFADVEAQQEILTEAQDIIEDNKIEEEEAEAPATEEAPAAPAAEEPAAEVEVDAATEEKLEAFCEKLENLDEEKVGTAAKNFAMKRLAKIRKMKVTNFAEAEEKLQAIEDVLEVVDPEAAEEAKAETENKEENEVAKIEAAEKAIGELDAQFAEIDEDKVEEKSLNFAKKLMAKARSIKVTNFAEAEEKLELMNDAAEALVEKAPEAEEEAPAEDLAKAEEKIEEIAEQIEDLGDKVPADAKNFADILCKLIKSSKCKNMSEATNKLAALKNTAEQLMKLVDGEGDTTAEETPETAPENFADENKPADPAETEESVVTEEETVTEEAPAAEAEVEEGTVETEEAAPAEPTAEEAPAEESETEVVNESEVEGEPSAEPTEQAEPEAGVRDEDIVLQNFSQRPQAVDEYDAWVGRQMSR